MLHTTRSTVPHIATGSAGGCIFDRSVNREAISGLFPSNRYGGQLSVAPHADSATGAGNDLSPGALVPNNSPWNLNYADNPFVILGYTSANAAFKGQAPAKSLPTSSVMAASHVILYGDATQNWPGSNWYFDWGSPGWSGALDNIDWSLPNHKFVLTGNMNPNASSIGGNGDYPNYPDGASAWYTGMRFRHDISPSNGAGVANAVFCDGHVQSFKQYITDPSNPGNVLGSSNLHPYNILPDPGNLGQ